MATTPTRKEHKGGEVLKQIVDSIQSLGDRLENKMEQLHTDVDCFRHEIKENLDVLKATMLFNVEKENNVALENYTHRKNLKFMGCLHHTGLC